MTHTVESLIAFEQRVADAFAAKQIRAPIHLSNPSQADHLIRIFQDFRPGVDWLFSGWRNHIHCLLAGMPKEELFDAIRAGRSMFVCSAKHKIICSGIVGGILPIACGVAMGIKKNKCPYCTGGLINGSSICDPCFGTGKDRSQVHVFVGDMTARTGLFHEFKQYCQGHELPVRITIEDNGCSTNANTEETWGRSTKPLQIDRYKYERTYPHTGIEQFVNF